MLRRLSDTGRQQRVWTTIKRFRRALGCGQSLSIPIRRMVSMKLRERLNEPPRFFQITKSANLRTMKSLRFTETCRQLEQSEWTGGIILSLSPEQRYRHPHL